MKTGLWIIMLIAISLAATRVMLVGHPHDLLMNCFKDFAHLFIGGLIASWWSMRTLRPKASALYGQMAIALSTIEVGCAIAGALTRA